MANSGIWSSSVILPLCCSPARIASSANQCAACRKPPHTTQAARENMPLCCGRGDLHRGHSLHPVTRITRIGSPVGLRKSDIAIQIVGVQRIHAFLARILLKISSLALRKWHGKVLQNQYLTTWPLLSQTCTFSLGGSTADAHPTRTQLPAGP